MGLVKTPKPLQSDTKPLTYDKLVGRVDICDFTISTQIFWRFGHQKIECRIRTILSFEYIVAIDNLRQKQQKKHLWTQEFWDTGKKN